MDVTLGEHKPNIIIIHLFISRSIKAHPTKSKNSNISSLYQHLRAAQRINILFYSHIKILNAKYDI